MGDTCRACALPPERLAALRASVTGGESISSAAPRFGLSVAGLWRHVKRHEPAGPPTPPPVEVLAAVKALAPAPVDSGDVLLEKLAALDLAVDGALEGAKAARSIDLLLRSVRTSAELLRLKAELLGKLQARQAEALVDLRLVGAFAHLRRAMVEALGPYPEARVALARVLTRGDES